MWLEWWNLVSLTWYDDLSGFVVEIEMNSPDVVIVLQESNLSLLLDSNEFFCGLDNISKRIFEAYPRFKQAGPLEKRLLPNRYPPEKIQI